MIFAERTTTMTTKAQVVNYLLFTYATDENITYTKVKITMLTQPSNKTHSHYSGLLVVKELRCRDVYDEHGLKYTFNDGLD